MRVSVLNKRNTRKRWFKQACAHRYRIINRVSGYSWGKGICILFNNDLHAEEPVEPCGNYATMHDFKHQECQCQAGTSTSITAVCQLRPFVACFYFSRDCYLLL